MMSGNEAALIVSENAFHSLKGQAKCERAEHSGLTNEPCKTESLTATTEDRAPHSDTPHPNAQVHTKVAQMRKGS